MMKDIKVTAYIKHNNINAVGGVGFIRDIDTSEPYEGSYDVSVVNTQILPTNGKRMAADLTIRQGADTYTGATTLSVTDSDVVINTQNKLVQSNITLKQGYPKYRGLTTYDASSLNGTAILNTKDTYLTQNIQISNNMSYFPGPYSYVIEDEGLFLITRNMRMRNFITVDISALEALADEISEVVG